MENGNLYFRVKAGDLFNNYEKVLHWFPRGVNARNNHDGTTTIMEDVEVYASPSYFSQASLQWELQDAGHDPYEGVSKHLSKVFGMDLRVEGRNLTDRIKGGFYSPDLIFVDYTPRLYLFPIEQVPVELAVIGKRVSSNPFHVDRFLYQGLLGRLEQGF